MDIDRQTRATTTIALRSEDKPEHGTVLLARLEAATQRVMDYDPVRGLCALRALLAKHKHALKDHTSFSDPDSQLTVGSADRLVGPGVQLPKMDTLCLSTPAP